MYIFVKDSNIIEHFRISGGEKATLAAVTCSFLKFCPLQQGKHLGCSKHLFDSEVFADK